MILEQLAVKYGTDKQMKYHNYIPVYEKLLEPHRNIYTNILEIGVREGGSHKMWYDYFPHAMIYGVDNMSDVTVKDMSIMDYLCGIENDRIKIYIGSQTDEALLNRHFDKEQLDLIIDDGGHHSKLHQECFKIMWPKLKQGHYYIIEDLATCYMRDFREFDDVRSSTINWLQSIMQNKFFSYYMDDSCMKEIESVQIIGELGIIKKRLV